MDLNYSSLYKALIVFQLIAFSCTAQIIEDFQYEYYPVDISSSQEYHRATANSSPFKSHDSTAIGLHRVSFSWAWTPEVTNGGTQCRATNFILYHKTRIDLPQLTSSANNKQAKEFHYYSELIKQHELEHYYIAKNYALAFEQQVIRELGTYSQCSQIDDEIQRIFNAAMIEHTQQQNDFDQRDYKISKIKEVERLLRQQ